jgi:hypothetical protein
MSLPKILGPHIGSIRKAQYYFQITIQYTASQIVVYL